MQKGVQMSKFDVGDTVYVAGTVESVIKTSEGYSYTVMLEYDESRIRFNENEIVGAAKDAGCRES